MPDDTELRFARARQVGIGDPPVEVDGHEAEALGQAKTCLQSLLGPRPPRSAGSHVGLALLLEGRNRNQGRDIGHDAFPIIRQIFLG